MTGMFEDREKAAEAKWAYDAELRFKIIARRNKLVGLWAAENLELPRKPSAAYIKDLIELGVIQPGTEALFERIKRDFAERKISLSDHMIRKKIEELQTLASDQILAQ